MQIYLIFPHGVSCLYHKKLNKGGLLSYFHSESNFTQGKIGLTWCTWVHLMIIGQMTKKWCNRLPPSVRVSGANRMTEVRCKNSITRQQKGSQREKCKVDSVLKNQTLRRRDSQVQQVSFYERVPVLKAAGEAYLCPPRQSTKEQCVQ